MNWFSIIFSFFKTDLGKKVGYGAVIGIAVGGALLYVSILKGEIKDEKELRKMAENNVVLLAKDFNLLHDKHANLVNEYELQGRHHKYAIDLLNEKHKKDVERVVLTTKIKEDIKNVKDEDDGEIANVLSDTLDALRLYK